MSLQELEEKREQALIKRAVIIIALVGLAMLAGAFYFL